MNLLLQISNRDLSSSWTLNTQVISSFYNPGYRVSQKVACMLWLAAGFLLALSPGAADAQGESIGKIVSEITDLRGNWES